TEATPLLASVMPTTTSPGPAPGQGYAASALDEKQVMTTLSSKTSSPSLVNAATDKFILNP
ncbi:MAG: hypothetical protein WA984_01020, partial [Phormidesmis sp.]